MLSTYPTPDSLDTKRKTHSSRYNSPRNRVHQGGLEDDKHIEGFQFQTLFLDFSLVEEVG